MQHFPSNIQFKILLQRTSKFVSSRQMKTSKKSGVHLPTFLNWMFIINMLSHSSKLLRKLCSHLTSMENLFLVHNFYCSQTTSYVDNNLMNSTAKCVFILTSSPPFQFKKICGSRIATGIRKGILEIRTGSFVFSTDRN
jgi:hypothetical protein